MIEEGGKRVNKMNSSGYREGQTMHKVDCDLWIEQHKEGQRKTLERAISGNKRTCKLFGRDKGLCVNMIQRND